MTDIPAATEPRKPRRGRPPGPDDATRRAAIVDIARQTFVELGFAGTTTDEVAARCRISKQTLYRLFGSKQDLFLAVVAAHRQTMLDLPRPDQEDLPVDEALARIFLLEMDDDMDRQRHSFVHLVIRESEQFPEIGRVLHTEGLLKSLHDLAGWLGRQRDLGKVEIDDTLSAARMLMDMIFGGRGAPQPRMQDWMSGDRSRQHLYRCIRIFSRGTAPDRQR